jgi:hypothetical protein
MLGMFGRCIFSYTGSGVSGIEVRGDPLVGGELIDQVDECPDLFTKNFLGSTYSSSSLVGEDTAVWNMSGDVEPDVSMDVLFLVELYKSP